MATQIEDGAGSGNRAAVTSNNRLLTQAHTSSFQHAIAHHDEGSYQVVGTVTASSGTLNLLHIKNIATDNKLLVATYIRAQVIGSGGATLPDTGNYFSVSFGEVYASGGTEVTPVNMTSGSAKTATVTAYGNDPTLTGTAVEFDRFYPKQNAEMVVWNKEGALIVPPGETITLKYIGDQSSGTIFARISFVMDPKEH